MRFLYRALFLFFIAGLFAVCFTTKPAHAATFVSSDIVIDTRWNKDKSPYIISGHLNVSSDATLILDQGIVVKFDSGAQLTVEGTVIGDGLAGEKIRITSLADDSIAGDSGGDGVSTPKKGDYAGFTFSPGSKGVFKNVDLGYGYFGISATSADITLLHSSVHDTQNGFNISLCNVILSNNMFTANDYPVQLDFSSTVDHAGNRFSENTYFNAIEYRGGTAPKDFVLSGEDPAYVLPGIRTIPGLETLAIEPGVDVYINKERGSLLTIDRGQTLLSHGTEEYPIRYFGMGVQAQNGATIDFSHSQFFTPPNDSAVLGADGGSELFVDHVSIDGGSVGIQAGSDSSVRIHNSRFSHARACAQILHGGVMEVSDSEFFGCEMGLRLSGDGHVKAQNISVHDMSQAGIHGSDGANTGKNNSLELHGSSIIHNRIGLEIEKTELIVSGNAISGNDIGARSTDTSEPVLLMENNWWGDVSGPQHPVLNPEGKGNEVSDNIDFDPWLGEYTNTIPPNPDPIPSPDPVPDPMPVPDPEPDPVPQPGRLPVILIPGIMGTEIAQAYGDHEQLWPSINRLILSPTDSFLNDLSLRADGTEDPEKKMVVGDILRTITPPVGSPREVFGEFIRTFTSAGYEEGKDLFVFPYDWRMSNRDTAMVLREKIEVVRTQTGKEKVNIVAHSMGGLVAKEYVAQYGPGAVEQLVFIGTPHLGSPKATKMLLYGDSMGLGVGKIKVLSSTRARVISQNMPAVFELMPSQKYGQAAVGTIFAAYTPANAADRIVSADYTATKNFLLQKGKNSGLLRGAESVHSTIDSMEFPGIIVSNFVGCGSDPEALGTIGGILLKQRMSVTPAGKRLTNDYQIVPAEGDGIVPLISAEAVVGNTYVIRDTSHASLPSGDGVADVVLALFDGAQVVSHGSVSLDSGLCGQSYRTISTHGPVKVDVYDMSGNHTGIGESGEIEYQIPGVSMDAIEDVTFVSVPFGYQYRVQITALEQGAYDLYLHDIAIGVQRGLTYFDQIPLTTESATAMLTLSDDNSLLYEDFRGVVTPSAVLSGVQSVDIASPITTALISEGIVTLIATDASSGILKAEYSFDGNIWYTYAAPFEAAGKTVRYLSTDKAGNVESEQLISVPSNSSTTTGGSTGGSGAMSGGGTSGSGGTTGGGNGSGASGTGDTGTTDDTEIIAGDYGSDSTSEGTNLTAIPSDIGIYDVGIQQDTIVEQKTVAENLYPASVIGVGLMRGMTYQNTLVIGLIVVCILFVLIFFRRNIQEQENTDIQKK